MERVSEAVEGQCAGERDRVPAIDQPATEPPLSLGELVKVNPRRVLVKAGRKLVLCFFHRHAIDVIDALARCIIAESLSAAGESVIVGGTAKGRAGRAHVIGCNALRQWGYGFSPPVSGLRPVSQPD